MGELAVSRAIGDHCLRPYVIPEPEVSAQGSHWPAGKGSMCVLVRCSMMQGQLKPASHICWCVCAGRARQPQGWRGMLGGMLGVGGCLVAQHG